MDRIRSLRKERRQKERRWIHAQRKGRYPRRRRWFLLLTLPAILLLSSCSKLIWVDIQHANPSPWDRTCYQMGLCGDQYDLVTEHFDDWFADWRGCVWHQKRAHQYKDGWWSGQEWDHHEWVYDGPRIVLC